MNLQAVLLLAAFLSRPPSLVGPVYEQGGLLAVALVEEESRFVPTALGKNYDKRGRLWSTDWGLFQLNSAYHPQFRDSLPRHISYGSQFLKALVLIQGDRFSAVARYNGSGPKARLYAERVLHRYRLLLSFCWLRGSYE